MAQPSSSDFFIILGEQVLKRTVYLGVAFVLLVGGGAFGFLYFLLTKNSASVVHDAEPAPVVESTEVRITAEPVVLVSDEQETSSSVSDVVIRAVKSAKVSSLSHLIEKYLKATGFGELDALIATGTATTTAGEVEVSLYAHRPNLYKLKTASAQRNVSSQFGYDGQEGWYLSNHTALDSEQVEFFMRVALLESSIAHLAWSYQSENALEFGVDAVLELLPSEQWEGRQCAVVATHSLLPFKIYHYIDLQTFEEVCRRAEIAKGLEQVKVEVRFSPPAAEAPVRIPMGYELYFDGVLYDTVDYSTAKSSRMILPSLFQAPEDASVTGLVPPR